MTLLDQARTASLDFRRRSPRSRLRQCGLSLFAVVFCTVSCASAQVVRPVTGLGALEQRIEKLRVVGSLLMIAAHPDDENNRSLAYYAQGRKLRTGYLSLTRGEGGQNLLGSEKGALLGVIRTQELLMARRVDGAEQYFSRAIDFGFSKTSEESISKWGREETLSDIVWVIRKFRPDVIVLSFSGTPRDGHGHHQASAILAKEAFHAAADPKRFPEQLDAVQPWQAKRVVWNTFFGRARDVYPNSKEILIDTGEYNPVLGVSYAELGGWSRTQHRSQGQGFSETKGTAPVSMVVVEGAPMERDFMDGIDVSWSRLPGGAAVDTALEEALHALTCTDTDAAIPALLKARGLIAAIDHPEARLKLKDMDETIAQAMGLWLDVSVNREEAAPGMEVVFDLTAVNRTRVPASIVSAQLEGQPGRMPDAPAFAGLGDLSFNQPKTAQARYKIPGDEPPTQPYWLRNPPIGERYDVRDRSVLGLAENPPVLVCHFRVKAGDQTLELVRPVARRFTDHMRGEMTQPFVIVPRVSLEMPATALVFTDAQPRSVEVGVTSNWSNEGGSVELRAPEGWKVEPASQRLDLIAGTGQRTRVSFQVTPPAQPSSGTLRAFATNGGGLVNQGIVRLTYEHIPQQTIQSPAETHVVRANVQIAAKRIGYVVGAGDEVPDVLRQLGCEVTLLDASDLARGDLSKFDAIVTGVRAMNLREDLKASHQRLWDYVEQGGTVVVQYNVLEGFGGPPGALPHAGPYPITISRNRVTVEDSPVEILNATDPLLNFPNKIVQSDFDGWVQERGLYFPSEWDSKYKTVIASNDPGEKPLPGGILYTRYGQGAYVYTSYSWFRQLPAGVPGALRIFANLVSAGKAPR
jgi:LmbE family N-acetylglucosaminyl deacetylase